MFELLLLRCVVGSDDNPLLTSTGSGFTHVFLKPGRSTTVALSGRTVVIIDAPADTFNYSITSSDNEVFHHPRPYPYRHLLVSGESLVLGAVSRSLELPLWVLPSGVCSVGSAVLSSEHFLSLKSKATRHPDPICLFSQAEFHEAELSALVRSRDKSAKVVVYGAKSGDEPIAACALGQSCRVTERAPFFLRIRAHPNWTVNIKVSYEIEHPAQGTVYCSVLSVPWVRGTGYGQIAQVLGGMTFVCRSQALDILGILGFIGLALLALFITIGLLHSLRVVNVGDWLFPDFEKKRFDGLKKDPYATEFGDPHTEAVETA
jgi:hypothetical protein